MKTTKSIKFSLLSVAATLLTACYNYDWKEDLNTSLTPVMITAGDIQANMLVNYRDSTTSGNTYILSWEKASAADYSTVFYKVLFYMVDEASPVHVVIPEKNGVENQLNLSERELNIIAEKAGIAQNATGNIHWKVYASNGINEIYAAESRTIAISRPDGYAYYPEQLYILGSATPYGTVESNVALLRKVTTSEYCAYVHLSDGRFYIKEKDRLRRFLINDDNTFRELGEDEAGATNVPVTPGMIHFVSLDFKNLTARLASIDRVELWYSGINNVWGELEQLKPGYPVWSLIKDVVLVNYPSLLDFRYKFRLSETDMKGDSYYHFLGSSVSTMLNISDNTADSYFAVYDRDDSRSSFCYKFALKHNNATLQIDLDLQSGIDFYRHYITVISN
jgi:hypothetical protein